MKDGLYNVTEVTEIVGITTPTLESWLRFKHEQPEHELSMLLPEPKRVGPRKARYWTKEEVRRIMLFKEKLPRGCKGILGTPRYYKKNKEKN